MSELRLGDVVRTEVEQLEQYGEAAQEFFITLSGEIREEFSSSLNKILTGELASFQTQANRSLATSGYATAGNLLGSLAGELVGGLLPDNLFGGVYGAAINGAVRAAVADYLRTGSVDMRRVVTGANSSGGSVLTRQNSLNLSAGQQSAEAAAALQRAQRNL